MQRYSLFLAMAMFLSTPSTNAIVMTNEGLDTGSSFIAWKDLASLPKQVKLLQACTVILAGVVVYTTWFKQSPKVIEKNITNDDSKLNSNAG